MRKLPDYILKRDLRLYMRFEAASYNHSAGDVKDESLNGNDGQSAGAMAVQTGVLGKAVNWDGSTDEIDIPYDASLAITGNLSFAVWVNTSDTTSGIMRIFYDAAGGNNANYEIYYNLGRPLIVLGNGATTTSAVCDNTIAGGIWQHVVITVSGTTVTFYCDGEVCGATKTVSFAPQPNATILRRVNRAFAAAAWQGDFDELALWARCLTQEEVRSMYNGGSARVINRPGNTRGNSHSVIASSFISEEI